MPAARYRNRRARPPAPVSTPYRKGRWYPFLVAIAAVLVYSGGFSGPFVFDDRGSVIDNTTIEDLGSAAVFTAPHETPTAGRPVPNLSFAVNYAFGGRDVTGYHVLNVALHVLCALVVLGIARRAQPSGEAALAIALIWAVHPLNSEVVNYLTQRTESLMALFYLLTLYCAIRAAAREPGGAGGGRWEVAAIAACALGMASKESMVTAPVAVLLYDRMFLFPSLREAVRARVRLYAGLAATWIVLGLLMWGAPRNLSAGFSAHDADGWTYLLNQAVMITRYLRLAVWPRDLVLYYGWPLPLALGDILPEALLVVTLAVAAGIALWKSPRAGFLGAWFFLTLAPTSSIVPIATEVGAERRMYLPLLAVVALAVMAYRGLVISPPLRTAGLAASTLLLGAATVMRTTEYESSLRLAQTTFERWPTPAAHSMLGTELAAAGRLPEAEHHLRAAAPVHPPAQYYLATVLSAQDRREEAIAQFTAFIAGQPAELDQVHVARALLAETLTREGKVDEAAAQYRAMLAARPDDAQATRLLAEILLRQQRFDEAITTFRRAADLQPSDASTLVGLGIALASSGRLDEAITAFERAVAADPQNPHAQRNLARAKALKK